MLCEPLHVYMHSDWTCVCCSVFLLNGVPLWQNSELTHCDTVWPQSTTTGG
jgi:hypothetical protein